MTPEGVFRAVSRHGWMLFIVVTCANGAAWWWRAQGHIRTNPSLRSGYTRLIRGWLLYGNLPWLVMGLGILFGDVPTVFHYLNPRHGPVVLAWYVTVIGLWAASVHWIFLRHGAETLIAHPGLVSVPGNKPWVLKAYFLLCLSGGVAGLLLTLLWDPPVDLPVPR